MLPRPVSPSKSKSNAASGIPVSDTGNLGAAESYLALNHQIEPLEKLLHPVNFQRLGLVCDTLQNEPAGDMDEERIDDLGNVNLILIDHGNQDELNQLFKQSQLLYEDKA